MKKILKYSQIIGGLIAFGPVLISLLIIPFLVIFNCSGMGGGPGTCGIGGKSMAEFLWRMGMMHWYTLITFIPGMVIFFVASIIALFIKNREKKLMANAESLTKDEQISVTTINS